MKLLLLLLVFVAIVKANINIKDFDHVDSPFDTDNAEQNVTRSPTEEAIKGTLQDAPVRDGSDPQGPGLDEDFFGEETTPLRAMRKSKALNFKDDSRDNFKNANANIDEFLEEARRHFVDNEVGPLRASRRSDGNDLGEVKSEDIGLEGVYPYDDHLFGSEGDIVDGSGEELDGFRDEDELFDFNNGEADEEDEDGMEFQNWSSAWKTAKSALKAGGQFLKTGLKTAGRGVKHGLKRAGSLVKNGVKRALPHLKEVGREFRDRAKTFIKENGMDILFDGIRGAMGRGAGGDHGPAPADYDDTEDERARNPYYGHAAETREEYDMPKRENRGSKRDHGNRDEDGDREAFGHRGGGSRRYSEGGKSGGHDDKDFEDDDASENDNDDAEENRGAEKRAERGKQGRGSRGSQRGSGSRDEDEGASGDREEEGTRPSTRKEGKRDGSGGGGKKPARTEKRTERGPSGKPKYNFKKGQSAEDAAEEAFNAFAERMGEDIAEKYWVKITECIEDAFFDKINHEADEECSRFFKQ